MDFRIRPLKNQEISRKSEEDSLVLVLRELTETVKLAVAKAQLARVEKDTTNQILGQIRDLLKQKDERLNDIDRKVRQIHTILGNQVQEKRNENYSLLPIAKKEPNQTMEMEMYESEIQKLKQRSFEETLSKQKQKQFVSHLNQESLKPIEPFQSDSSLSKQVRQLRSEVRKLGKNPKEPRNITYQVGFSRLSSDKLKRSKQIKAYVANLSSQVFSVSFNMYFKQKVDFEKIKVYCSENILGNLIEMIRQEKIQKQQIEMIDQHLSSVVLPFLKLSYPHSEQKEVNQKLKTGIVEKDIFNENRFDIIFNSPIKKMTWHDKGQKKNDDDNSTIKEIMNIVNHIIELPESKQTKNGAVVSLSELFEEDILTLFRVIENRRITNFLYKLDEASKSKLVSLKNRKDEQKRANPKQQQSGENKQSSKEKQNKIPVSVQLDDIFKDIENDLFIEGQAETEKERHIQELKSYTKYRIGRKISPNAEPYSKQEIERGEMSIKENSIRRVLTKWTESLEDQFDNPSRVSLIRSQFLKLNNGEQFNNQTLDFKQKIIMNLKKESLALSQSQLKIKKHQYELFWQTIHHKNNSTAFEQFCSERQSKVGEFCTTVSKASENYVINHIKLLINSLKLIQQQLSYQLAFSDLQQFQKFPLIVNFKLGDLLRCQISSKQKQIVAIYEYICLLSEYNPKIFEIVRVKNRFDGPNKDILINVWYRQKIMIELQLAIKNQSPFLECSDKYSHFIYELKRVFLGPISEFVSVWKNYSPKSDYFAKVINPTEKIAVATNLRKCKKKQHKYVAYKENLKLPFWCNTCAKFITKIQERWACVNCPNNMQCKFCFNLSIIQKENSVRIHLDQEKLQQSSVFAGIEISSRSKYYYLVCKVMGKKSICSFSFILDQFRRKLVFQRNLYEASERKSKTAKFSQFCQNHFIYEDKSTQFDKTDKESLMQQIMQKFWLVKMNEMAKKKIRKLALVVSCNPPLPVMMIERMLDKVFNDESTRNHFSQIQKIMLNELFIYNYRNLQQLKKLRILSLRINRLNDISQLPNFEHLLTLDLSKNKIRNFSSMRKFKNLRSLYVVSNQLTSLSGLESMENLQNLDLSWNKLENLENMPAFPNLSKIRINYNKLKSFTGFLSLPKLQFLQFQNNQIESFEAFPQMDSLKQMNLNKNKIQGFKGLPELATLQDLKLGNNFLKDFEQMPALNSLRELNVSSCKISTFSGMPRLKNLRRLVIYFNNINNFEKMPYLPMLKDLVIHSSHMTSFEGLPQSTSIESLKIEYNRITNFSGIGYQEQLHQLILQGNSINTFDGMPDFPTLQILILSFNRISSFQNMKPLQYLIELNLRRNEITTLKGMPYLPLMQKLSLAENKIVSLEGMKHFLNLRDLQLQRNQISSFDGLPQFVDLIKLDLSENKLQQFEHLPPLQNLQQFNLDSNNFQSLCGIVVLPKLRKLSLNRNQFNTLKGMPELHNLEILELEMNPIQGLQGFPKLIKLQSLNIVWPNLNIIKSVDLLSLQRRLQKVYVSEETMALLQKNNLIEDAEFDFVTKAPKDQDD